MSSDFQFVCMSHDPPFFVGHEYLRGDVEWETLPATVAEVRAQHPGCDLTLTESSGAIVKLGCLTPGHPHAAPRWIDMDVVRVLLHARPAAVAGGPLAAALERHFDARECWPNERILKLKELVDLGPW